MLFNISSWQELVYRLVGVILALTVHEFSHGFAAYLLGDKTAKAEGRLSLNPAKHVDIFGAIMLLLVGFGWAKPVSVNPWRFKKPKAGMAISAFAGPFSNFLAAFIFYIIALIVQINFYGVGIAKNIIEFLVVCISINIGLGIFNLIPIPPLDGSRIFLVFLPEKQYFRIMQYERYAMIALMVLLFLNILDKPLMVLTQAMWGVIETGAVAIVSLFL